MEMSLSIDNIFVFVLIFSSLQIHKNNVGRVLMIGVALAIIFRIIFIAVGIVLVTKFSWLLYAFGAFLLYTGFKLFFGNQEEENDVKEGGIYKFIRKYLRYTDIEPEGKFVIQKDGKAFFTKLFLAILIIGVTDIVFALDSIPAVFAISTDNLVVFSSNIFAVLGLRALFFILQKAADQFDYLQQGIAIVLIFIGAKMFLGLIDVELPNWISLLVIILCISGSIIYSMYHNRKKSKLTHDSN
jgi:tellurite resistance protein TerC